MEIKFRDWFILLAGVTLVLLGGFQIIYNLEAFQTKDFILSGILFLGFGWLFFMYKYKDNKDLFDEYYSEKFFKSLEYGLALTVGIIWVMLSVFAKENMISINYIYGAIRLGMGLWLLYFSFLIMKDGYHE
jgi:hypothetical protein